MTIDPDSGASNLKFLVSYSGASFTGSQRQPGQRTVQGELEKAWRTLTGHDVAVVLAGRTDRGVHAVGQVGSCRDTRPELATDTIQQAINANLPEEVAIRGLERCSASFHARFDASWREYRYRIWNGVRQPLVQPVSWNIRSRLDIEAMDQAARLVAGTRDVASLAGGGQGVPWSEQRHRPRSTVRTIYRARVQELEPWWGSTEDDGRLIEFSVVADGFLPRMVRNITALLVEVGHGQRPPSWIDQVMEQRDRRFAGGAAPAQGLILWRVGYDDERFDKKRQQRS